MTRVRRRWSPAGLVGLRHLSKLVAVALAADRDNTLVSLAAELEAKEAALRALFARDGRDTDEMPEFEPLADRCGVLVEQLRGTPARGLDGLFAKALCVRLRDPAAGYVMALAIRDGHARNHRRFLLTLSDAEGVLVVGYRTSIFEYDGVAGHQREYIAWLLSACADEGVKVADVIDEEAVDLLATKLRTPLQIEMHLELAFEAAYRAGARPVPLEIVDSVLSRTIDDLEPRLIRNGYDATTLAREFDAKPGEIRTFLSGILGADRTRELTDQMRAAGVPL